MTQVATVLGLAPGRLRWRGLRAVGAAVVVVTLLAGLTAVDGLPVPSRPAATGSAAVPTAASTTNGDVPPLAVDRGYADVPLAFEANQGQTDPAVDFLARGDGYRLFLTSTGAVLSLSRPQATAPSSPTDDLSSPKAPPAPASVVRMNVVGADPGAVATPGESLPGTANYLRGNDPSKWQVDVPTYGGVTYQNLYPGIDMTYYGTQGQLEYDFVVAPGAETSSIALGFEGADDMAVDAAGDLVLGTAAGPLHQRKPFVYQEVEGTRKAVPGRFVIGDDAQVGFDVGAYDRYLPLVIDPQVVYATYLGGSGADEGDAVVVDAAGNAYITGETTSADFPRLGPINGTYNDGAYSGNDYHGNQDAFVSKLSPDGQLLYSTYLGGSAVGDPQQDGPGEERPRSIALDAAGSAYVTGSTKSGDFPITANAFQKKINLDTGPGSGKGNADLYVSKLNPAGNGLVYSTYLGGSGTDGRGNIAVDSSGAAYLTGFTFSNDFPGTAASPIQAVQAGNADAFAAKLSSDGDSLVYATYLGGKLHDTSRCVDVDGEGNAYVVGWTQSASNYDKLPDRFPTTAGAYEPTYNGGVFDAFFAKINPAGTALVYSTYMGGSGDDLPYLGDCVDLDAAGNLYSTGYTTSTADYPVTPGAAQPTFGGGEQDAYAVKLNPTGSGLVYNTYLGGSGKDEGIAVSLDNAGRALYTGFTQSINFPVTPGALDTTLGGSEDAYITRLEATGALSYSTFFGGKAREQGKGIDVDASGKVYLLGLTTSTDFPVTAVPGTPPIQAAYAGSKDAFMAKFDLDSTGGGGGGGTPTLSINDASVNEGNTGTTTATFTVSLSGVSTQSVSVGYATSNGSAIAPEDYASKNGTLTFAPGETSKTVTVTVNGDTLVELNETFNVVLSGAIGATIAKGTGVGTIVNDDGGGGGGSPTLSVSDTSVLEGNAGTANLVFTVSLSAPATGTVSVKYATNEIGSTATQGVDYAGVKGALQFLPGETTKTITVKVRGDTETEPDETVVLDLADATGASIFDGTGVGTIVNDDGGGGGTPTLSINDVSVNEGNIGATTATFTVSLSGASAQAVTVGYATSDGTAKAAEDYASTTGTLTFASGETSKTVTVTVNGDTVVEPNETFNVVLSNPTGATIAKGTGVGTIVNDDGGGGGTPTLSVSDGSVLEGNAGTADLVFTVSLSAPATGTVSVKYATQENGSATQSVDYAGVKGALQFAPGETTKTVTVKVRGDTDTEPNETFVLYLTDATGAPIFDGTGIGTIVNDD